VSSTTARLRKRRPSVIWSCTKSSDQRWFGLRGNGIGERTPMAPLAPAAAAHHQPLLLVQPVNPLAVDSVAFPAQ